MKDVSLLRRFVVAAVALVVIGVVLFDLSEVRGVEPAVIDVGGARIDVSFIDGPFDLPFEARIAWVRAAADAVTAYYGRFPVPHLMLRVSSMGGAGIDHGKTFGRPDGGLITISLGRSSSERDVRRDWTLTHEMVHLAFPSVEENHHWMEEGLATYIEPWARVYVGQLKPERVWGDFVRDMPQGLPESDDRGLDRTPTWGRTYWGGAWFCLLADVEINSRTHNKKGLRDALRAIIDAGGDISREWDLERALKIGDKATGVPVLQQLYAQMKDKPFPVDLDMLWIRLGVKGPADMIRLDDGAPIAPVRKAIETGK